MAQLSVANFPDDLMRSLKAQAALAGITLREHLIATLTTIAATPPQATPAKTKPSHRT